MTDTTFCTSSSSTVQVTLRMVSGRVMKLLVEAGQQRRQVIHFAGAVEQQLVPKGGGHEPRTHVRQPGRRARCVEQCVLSRVHHHRPRTASVRRVSAKCR